MNSVAGREKVMDSDAVLVERILSRNDQQAFTHLVMRHQLVIRRLLHRSCRHDRHLVDDLVQETFLRAYLSLAGFRSDAKFSTWLYRIAFNVAADKFRRGTLDFYSLESIQEQADPCKYLGQADLRNDLAEAFDKISKAQQCAVRLCLEEGYTHVDAAQAMSLPLGTVKSHLARGRAQLQQLLVDWEAVA